MSARAFEWLNQAEQSLQQPLHQRSLGQSFEDASFSTPKPRKPPAAAAASDPVSFSNQSLSPSQVADDDEEEEEDPFDSKWKTTSALFSSPSKRAQQHDSNVESAKKKAERFLTIASYTPTTKTVSAKTSSFILDPSLLHANTPVLLRCQQTAHYLQAEGEHFSRGFQLEACEVVLEKSPNHAPNALLHFGDLVWIKFLASGRYLGERGELAGQSRDQAGVASWICKSPNAEEGEPLRSNCAILFEHSDGRFLSNVRGFDNETVWNLVRSNGAATCYLPAATAPLTSSNALVGMHLEEDECTQLLDLFLGVRGNTGVLPPGLEEMQALAQHLFFLRNFVTSKAQQEYGRVVSALCFYLEERVLDPFHEFVSQLYLEDGPSLTLLINLLQPRCRIIVDWSRLLRSFDLSVLRGGALINALHEAKQWAFESPALCQDAIQACLHPYLQMLTTWLQRGVLEDPFGEFAVVRGGTQDARLDKMDLGTNVNSRYWTARFKLVTDINAIPWFLQQDAELVLKIGRNVQVLPPPPPVAVIAPPSTDSPPGREELRLMHAESNARVLAELHGAQLLPILLQFKRFFLMEQGDFFSHFFDVASAELAKPRALDRGRLEILLPILFRESFATPGLGENAHSVFFDNLSCVLLDEAIDVHVERIQNADLGGGSGTATAMMEDEQLLCADVFALDFASCTLPLALVLTRRSVTKYQLLFRHLFRCKHAERVVGQVWKLCGHANNNVVATSLVQRMTQFLQSFAYYVAFEVVEPRWRAFWTSAEGEKDLDALLELHEDFLDSCLKECLLTNPVLIRQFSRLLRQCLAFGDLYLAREFESMVVVDVSAQRVLEFDQELNVFLHLLRAEAKKSEFRNVHLHNLACRLDFSQFYS